MWAFLYFMNTLQTRWFIELLCRILSFTNPSASCSIFFDKIQAVLPYFSKLWVLIFLSRLVLSYQLDWTWFENRALYPHRHKYSLGDIIVSPTRFLGALIHRLSEVSSTAALFTLCTQTFYTKGTTKLPNCVYKSSHSFHLRDSPVKGLSCNVSSHGLSLIPQFI